MRGLPLLLLAAAAAAEDLKTYRSEVFGVELQYPGGYFHCPRLDAAGADYDEADFRKDTRKEAECRTVGKRIGLRLHRLDRDTTLEDLERQFVGSESRPAVRRSCAPQELPAGKALLCEERAPGEAPGLTGGIHEQHLLILLETAGGGRILARLSNAAGGTPHGRDKALRRDLLRVARTLRLAPK